MIRPSKVPPQKSNAGQYVQCGQHTFALNYKSASTAFVRAIIGKHHPELIEGADSMARPHRLLKKVPPLRPVLIVRDPVERFRSACAQTGKPPETAIAEIRQLPVYNVHFWPTSRLVVQGVQIFRFEDQLEEAAKYLGLDLPLPVANESELKKPELTKEQRSEVESIYANDIALHQSTKADADFEATMSRAFPEHLRGTISGCCDSMEDGHGTK